jgi:hypothetical protein
MTKKKAIQSIADNQRENSGRANIEPYKWKPGQSGNPNGRPLKALAQISIDKELGDQPCPEKSAKRSSGKSLDAFRLNGSRLLRSNAGSLTLMFSASRCVDTFVLLPNGIFRESSLFARCTQLRLAHANTATKVILNAAI